MTPRLLVPTLLLALACPLAAQRPAARAAVPHARAVLQPDPAVRIGTLPNGFRYYIRANAKPEKRAELRLVVNTGSVLEGEDQLGYAHFIEHAAFNGTTHFAKNELVSYLQGIGVEFGADLNAYTSFDETVYILPVPTDTAAIVARAFDILEDWAHGQTFDSAEVASERGVVREELRGGKGATDRVTRAILPVILKDSRYATRLPIGTEESIMAATPGALRRFYRTWYRPELMAVVAVGDFDPAQVERLVRAHFAALSGVPNAPPRPVTPVPGNRAPLVAIAKDRELTTTSVEVDFKRPRQPLRTVGDYRRALVEELYASMLNARLSEIAQRPDAPFLTAHVSTQGFVAREVSSLNLSAGVSDGTAVRGLEALLAETRRVDLHGFLPAELDRARRDLLRAYERAYAERDKTESSTLAEEYVAHFLSGDAIPGIAAEYALVRALAPGITLTEVNRSARRWISDENRVVTVSGPDKPDVPMPSEAELLAVFDRVAAREVPRYEERLSSAPLVARLPAPGRVTAQRLLPGTDIIEWTLSNGARVVVKPTDFKADEVLFSAWANGGTSLATDREFISAQLAPQLVALGGLGALSRVDLAKRLSGTAARVTPTMSETTHGLNGSASPKDLETLVQLAYLHFTAPRRDSAAYLAFRSKLVAVVRNRDADPDAVFADTIAATMGQHGPRSRPLSLENLGAVDLDRGLEFFRQRFADASDFTFVFVGSVQPAALRPLVERYLATLPATARDETWRNVTSGPPPGVHDVVVRKGREDKATTLLVYSGPFVYDREHRVALRALGDYLQIKLTETLRERLGGTYSPSAGAQAVRAPRAEYQLQVVFESSPANVETLTPVVLAMVDSLKRNGPSAADVEKVRAQLLRQSETQVRQNSYWLANISGRLQAGESLADLGDAAPPVIARLTAATIQQAARQFLGENRLLFVLLPETAP